jgi:hypothetical protein
VASVVSVGLSVLADAYDTSSESDIVTEDNADEDSAELMYINEDGTEVTDLRQEFNGKLTPSDWTGTDWMVMWNKIYKGTENDIYGWKSWWKVEYTDQGIKSVEDLGYVKSFTVPTKVITIKVGETYTLTPALKYEKAADYVANNSIRRIAALRWDGEGRYTVYNYANPSMIGVYYTKSGKLKEIGDNTDYCKSLNSGQSVTIKGLSRGTTWITLATEGRTKEYKQLTIKIKVNVVDPNVKSLRVANENVTIRNGKSVYDSYCVNVYDNASTDVTVKVTKGQDKITVEHDKTNKRIKITANKTGTATIKVTTKGIGSNGKKKTKYIKVKVVGKNKSCGKGKHTWEKWYTLKHHKAVTKTYTSQNKRQYDAGASCNVCGYHGSYTQFLDDTFINTVHAIVHGGGVNTTTYTDNVPIVYIEETKAQYDTKTCKTKVKGKKYKQYRCSTCGATKKVEYK